MRNPWVTYGDVSEGTEWFDLFLALPGEVPDAVRGRALVHRGDLAFEQEDYPAAGQCAQAALDLFRRSGDLDQAGALRLLALVSLRAGRHAGIERNRHVETVAHQISDPLAGDAGLAKSACQRGNRLRHILRRRCGHAASKIGALRQRVPISF